MKATITYLQMLARPERVRAGGNVQDGSGEAGRQGDRAMLDVRDFQWCNRLRGSRRGGGHRCHAAAKFAGYLRTPTARAYDAIEMKKLLGLLPT